MSMTNFNYRMVLNGFVVACVFASPLPAQKRVAEKSEKGSHSHIHSSPDVGKTKPSTLPKLLIPDVDVLDQHGRKRKFYTDFVKGKVVVINFVFTTCKGMCPLLGANFSRLQKALGERVGRDVFLISISTDPETDSPEKLKAWGEKFKPNNGWTFVTGQKEDLTPLLQVFTGDGPRGDYHAPSLCIINDSKKVHRWAYGFEAPERVIEMIDEMARGN